MDTYWCVFQFQQDRPDYVLRGVFTKREDADVYYVKLLADEPSRTIVPVLAWTMEAILDHLAGERLGQFKGMMDCLEALSSLAVKKYGTSETKRELV